MEQRTVTEAAIWFAQLRDPTVLATTREEFARWLLLSPAHARAYFSIERTWSEIGQVQCAPPAADLISAARTEVARWQALPRAESRPVAGVNPAGERVPPRRRWIKIAAAAAVMGATMGAGWLALRHRTAAPDSYRTEVGVQRSISLADGSVVSLNTDSQVQVNLSAQERRITIARGEARFTVAKDPDRPFVVTTPQASVRALGTIFNVRLARERTAVAVIEGRIVITGHGDRTAHPAGSAALSPEFDSAATAHSANAANAAVRLLILRSGQHATVTSRGEIVPDVGPSMARVKSWPNRRLVFRDEPLGELIEDFNRYHMRHIRIADPAIARYRVSGSFDADDKSSLLAYLAAFEDIRIETAQDGSDVLRQRAVPRIHATP